MSVAGGFNSETFYALSNAPTFSYNASLQNGTTILQNAIKVNFIIGTASADGSDKTMNQCNIPFGHAFSVIGLLNITS